MCKSQIFQNMHAIAGQMKVRSGKCRTCGSKVDQNWTKFAKNVAKCNWRHIVQPQHDLKPEISVVTLLNNQNYGYIRVRFYSKSDK